MLFDDLKSANADAWRAYTHHAFVEGMADGSLEEASFRHYLVQDYLFLIHFARAYALAIYKSRTLEEMRAGLDGVKAILDVEMGLHVQLCGAWGLTPADIEQAPESRATLAYTRYVLETGLRGDLLDLHVALSPCVIGYAEIAERIAGPGGAVDEANPYGVWINEYAGEAYQALAADARTKLDTLAGGPVSATRFDDLSRVFSQATRLEADFWQMGLDCAD